MNQQITHKFWESFQEGDLGAYVLDDFWGGRGHLTRTSPHEERQDSLGDRKLEVPVGGKTSVWFLEYKYEPTALKTGHSFLELVSNLEAGRPGWVLTTQADFIVWWRPSSPDTLNEGEVWMAWAHRVRKAAVALGFNGRVTTARNRSQDGTIFHGLGLLVKLEDLMEAAGVKTWPHKV